MWSNQIPNSTLFPNKNKRRSKGKGKNFVPSLKSRAKQDFRLPWTAVSSDITVRERNKACSPRVEIGRHDERVMKLPRVCNTGYIVERENNGGTDAFFAQGGEREVFEISLPRKLVHPLSSAFFIGRGEPLQEYFPGNFHPVISTFFFFFSLYFLLRGNSLRAEVFLYNSRPRGYWIYRSEKKGKFCLARKFIWTKNPDFNKNLWVMHIFFISISLYSNVEEELRINNNNIFHLTSFKKIGKVKTLGVDFIHFSNDILLKQNLLHITLQSFIYFKQVKNLINFIIRAF